MAIYGLIGNPVHRSLSPFLFEHFARQNNQSFKYMLLEPTLANFHMNLLAFEKAGGRGLNVTMPFKEIAYTYAHTVSEHAEYAGAINLLCLKENGQWHGDNVDGIGLIRDFCYHKISLNQKKILLIGAGGAARGLIGAILTKAPKQLSIVNRTVHKAKLLATIWNKCLKSEKACADIRIKKNHFAKETIINATTFSKLETQVFDLIINTTCRNTSFATLPLSPKILDSNTCCYDIVYQSSCTPFLTWAKTHSVKRCYNGIGMLIEQAAQTFYQWCTIFPDTTLVRTLLHNREYNPMGIAINADNKIIDSV